MSRVVQILKRGAIVVAAGAAVAAATPLAAPADATVSMPSLSSFDARLLHDINHARAAHGMRALTPVAGTTDVAHGWSCHLASRTALAHNLRLGSLLVTHGSALWTTYGENVGVVRSTASADTLFRAYMASPPHRANILDRAYRYVGMWSKVGAGRRWDTIDFVGSTASSYSYAYGQTRRTC